MTPKTYTVAELRHSTETGQFVRLEELVAAKRNEHNSEVAYKAAIEKQEELRDGLKWFKAGAKAEADAGDEARKSLTAAEQRNAELVELLDEVLNEVPHGWGESFSQSELAERIRQTIKPTESGASE